MSIRKKLQLGILVTGGLALLVFGLILTWTSRQVSEVFEQSKTVNNIVGEVFELNIVTNDYLLHHEERAQAQWQLRYSSLAQILTEVEAKYPEEELLDRVIQNHAELQPLFSQLVTSYVGEDSSELEQRLASQLAVKTQTMVADTFRLAETFSARAESARRRGSFPLMASGLIILTLMVSTIILVSNDIVARITNLHRGTEIIAAGDLDYKVDVGGHDEIGDLAHAFNEMAASLEKQIAERKQTERVQEALYTISQAAVTAENLEDLYLAIHHALSSLMPVDNFYIALYDPDSDRISFPYFVDQYDPFPSPRKPGRGLTEYVLRTGRPLLTDPQIFKQLLQQGEVELIGTEPVAWLGVPLKVGAKVLGVIAMQSYTENVRLAHVDTEMLEFFSTQVTTAIERKLAQQRIADALDFNKTLIDSSTFGIIAYDASGQCISANEASARIIGANRDQVLGQNFRQIASWKSSGLLEAAEETLASGENRHLEVQLTTTFGLDVWLDCHFARFTLENEPHLLLAVGDIIEHKRTEAALYASERRIAAVLEAVPLGIVISMPGPEGTVLQANPALLKIFGYDSEEEFLELPASAHYQDPLDRQRFTELLERGYVKEYETRFKRKDGTVFWGSISSVTRKTEDGSVQFINAILDITERKHFENQIQSYADKLERSNRDLQDFAYIASHDLQEPLRKVTAFSDRLVTKYGEAIDETGRDYLRRMQSATQRMQTLIDDLLAFSRVSTKGKPFIQVDMTDVAQEVLSDLESRIEQTGGQVEIRDLPVIDADPTQMRQLLQNLISNALKFHKQDQAPIVKVSGKQISDQSYQITVEDNVIGFDPQFSERIFQPFQRLHGRGEYEGSGMGLAICRRIVKRHGGSITADSIPGQGATFIVTLPLQQKTQLKHPRISLPV